MIDVMLPFYGDQELFRLAVRSVVDQSSPAWRLTVVDDCDPGPSVREWLSTLDDPRITYLRNETNLGTAMNFQRCLDLATADHLVLMGCDDVMHANYVSTVETAVRDHPGAAVIQPRVQVIDAAGQVVLPAADRVKARISPQAGSDVVLSGEALAVSLLRGNWMYFPAILWRRDVMAARSFRTDMATALDLDLLLGLVAEGYTFAFPAELAFSYRRHSGSVSSVSARTAERFSEEASLFAGFAERFAALGWPRAARAARWHVTSRLHALVLALAALRGRDLSTSRTLLRHAASRTERST
jgi:glycosyltransferase involved in cell wall biosynthesis